MRDPDDRLLRQVDEHEAGVADLIAAYELAERQYFAAVRASSPHFEPTIASNSTS